MYSTCFDSIFLFFQIRYSFWEIDSCAIEVTKLVSRLSRFCVMSSKRESSTTRW